MSVFIKDGYICKIDKEEEEENETFYKRGWFMVSQKPSQLDYNLIKKYYKIWKNIKDYECVYSDEIMEKIENIEKNILIK